MKFLITFISMIFSMSLLAQADHVPNSYRETYDSRFPALTYSYDPLTQTHNYSGNWDFDGDKKTDSLFFIGNGGAHLYFHLQLKLSSENSVRDFRYLVSDFPMLDSISRFKKNDGQYSMFVVHDFNNDGRMDIYLHTDTRFVPIPLKWRKRGVTSGRVLINYERKDIVIRDFSDVSHLK